MYLPFLRGKLFELKAIKEFIEESYNKEHGCYIMPIIEPVKKDIKPMLSCVEAMSKAKMPFAIVLNTRMGDYQHKTFDIETFLDEDRMKAVTEWTPAFEVNGNANVENIEQTIADHDFKNVMLIFFYGVDLNDEKVNRLISNANVTFVAVLNLGQSPTMRRKLAAKGKKLIAIEDRFVEQPSNNAYRENEDEFFTDTFCYYRTDYKMFGFSDFTALAKNYREGGVLPQVVAIHLAYQKNEDEVYIHHFLSDTKNGSDDIRNEFEEAKDKILPFFEGKVTTLAIRQLVAGGYPGLGAIKKFSIKNHFELMSRILHEKED